MEHIFSTSPHELIKAMYVVYELAQEVSNELKDTDANNLNLFNILKTLSPF